MEHTTGDDIVNRQRSGKCWNCGKPKVNPYGLCGGLDGCGRFGMSENEIERRLDPEKMREWMERHDLNI